MDDLQRIDELYAAFWRTLPGMLHSEAQGLAHSLKLAPSRDVAWSSVFQHEITLAAPAMIAEAMSDLRGALVQDAMLAHMLAVIEAFGTDRIHDGQIQPTWQLETVLAHVRRARDEAIHRIASHVDDPWIDYAQADDDVLSAIAVERELLSASEPVDIGRYQAISLGKQRAGFPACIALAHAAGWPERQRKALHAMLASIWLALQLHDDVMDWEEDYGRGGAWAVALALDFQERRHTNRDGRQGSSGRDVTISLQGQPMNRATRSQQRASSVPPSAIPSSGPMRHLVFESKVLALMLKWSARRYRQARRRAEALGAWRIASWAQARESQVAELARCEEQSPGYAHRAHALSTWAKTVLA